ncbi:MAG: EcsC family protein [Candidatus Wallbacteria bacterium]|nr:EcsC family protein [Candidatus Wallbacteria bacterium]
MDVKKAKTSSKVKKSEKRVEKNKKRAGDKKSLICLSCNESSGVKIPSVIPKKVKCRHCQTAILLPSKYEDKHCKEIHAYKNPDIGLFDLAAGIINWPLEKIYAAVMAIPYADDAVKKSFGGIVGLLNDAAQWTVQSKSILEVYKKSGYVIDDLSEVRFLDLSRVDQTIGFLAAKYKTIAFTEGGLAGLPSNAGPEVAIPAIVADTLFIIGLNLRAIGEYAAYCGFDTSLQHERLFALNVLAFASSPSDGAKNAALANLIKISSDVAKKAPWKVLDERVFVKIIKKGSSPK